MPTSRNGQHSGSAATTCFHSCDESSWARSRRPLSGALEGIDETIVRANLVQATRREQAVDDPDRLRTHLSHNKHDQCLRPIGIARNTRSR